MDSMTDDAAISLAMQPQQMLKEITSQKRKEREAEILAATRQLLLRVDSGDERPSVLNTLTVSVED